MVERKTVGPDRQQRRRLRVGVAQLALVVAAGLSTAGPLIELIQLWRMGERPDAVAGYEPRFAEIRTLLPPHGVVGYLSDRMDAGREYYLTQFALAPLVVAPGPQYDLVIGNFFDPEAGAQIATHGGFVVIRDFGEGLMVLRRPGR